MTSNGPAACFVFHGMFEATNKNNKMAILDFQKPDKVIMINSDEFNGEFEFRPLEPGYGITVGNSLRRILDLPLINGLNITIWIFSSILLPIICYCDYHYDWNIDQTNFYFL